MVAELSAQLPPPMAAGAMVVPGLTPAGLLRALAGVALLVSAALSVAGSLVPNLYTAYFGRDISTVTMVTNLWGIKYNVPGQLLASEPGHSYRPGIPLVVGAALAALVGIALLRTARQPGQGPRGWAVGAGSALVALIATNCLTAESAHSRAGSFQELLFTERYGAGFGLLIAAGVTALAGVVAAALAGRLWHAQSAGFPGPEGPAEPTRPTGPVVFALPDDEPRTPPEGFPAQPDPAG